MSKLEQAKEKIKFIGRALSHGYVDADSLDELGREVYSALQLISEFEAEQRCIEIGSASSYRMTVFEPVNA